MMTDWCAWPAEAMNNEDRHPEHLVAMLFSVYLEALVYQQCVFWNTQGSTSFDGWP